MGKNIQKSRARLPIERRVSSVAVSENSRTFTVFVPGGRRPDVIHLDDKDGPYIHQLKSRCDYVIEIFGDAPKKTFFLVELKGDDVVKGLEQLAYTAEHLKDCSQLRDYLKFTMRHACVVASHGPPKNVNIPVTRQRKCEVRLKRCGFTEVKVRTHQLVAHVDGNGAIRYE